jgi:hypothetical protein
MTVNEVNLLVNGSSPVTVYCVCAAAHEQMVGGLNLGVQLAPNSLEGLHPPVLAATGTLVMGSETDKLWLQNRWQHHALQDTQLPTLMLTRYLGLAILPPTQARPNTYRNKMCPAGIATMHPTGDLPAEWSQLGCPTKTGKPWSKQEMWEVVARGPHQSSLSPKALAHCTEESILFGGSSKEGIMAGTPEGLAGFGQWSNSTMEYYYSGPPRAIHLSWIDI